MAINVSQAFHRTSANPVDDTLTLTKAEMLTVNDNLMPAKYFTVCQDDGAIYLYDKTNEADPATGKFRKFEGGGSGGSYTAGDGILIDNDTISTDGFQEGDMDDVVPTLPSPASAPDLDDLGDVDITSPSNNDVLTYNSTSGKWENGTGGSGSVAELGDIGDVNLTNISDGQILKWDNTNSEWVNANESGGSSTLEELTDVTVTTPADGQILKWDDANSVWVNADESAGVSDIGDLSDVTLTTPADGQVLLYDDANSEWINADVPGVDELSDIGDVEITSASDGDVLKWDATNSKWVNGAGGGGSYTAGDGIDITNDVISTDNLQSGDMDDIIDPLPTPGGGIDLDDLGNVNIESATDGQVLVYDETNNEWVNGSGGGGGDAALESAVTSNLAVGAIPSGTTLEQGTTFTEFVQKLLITEIAPTTTFTATGSGVKEVGTSVTPTLTLVINTVGTGVPTAIKFYDGSTLLDTKEYVDGTTSYSYTMSSAVTTTTTVKGVLEYKKSDDSAATIEKTATYTFVMASYYGAVTSAPTDKAGITALTKNVKNTKAQTATFTLSNQRSCYCYPASFGNLTSIKDANNFEYLSSYTKTTVAVDGTDYNVYTLTDPVTATGFKQVYA